MEVNDEPNADKQLSEMDSKSPNKCIFYSMTLLATTFVSIVTLIDRNSFSYSSYITLIDFNSFNYSSYITLIDCKALA